MIRFIIAFCQKHGDWSRSIRRNDNQESAKAADAPQPTALEIDTSTLDGDRKIAAPMLERLEDRRSDA